jgi:hypothetical protein
MYLAGTRYVLARCRWLQHHQRCCSLHQKISSPPSSRLWFGSNCAAVKHHPALVQHHEPQWACWRRENHPLRCPLFRAAKRNTTRRWGPCSGAPDCTAAAAAERLHHTSLDGVAVGKTRDAAAAEGTAGRRGPRATGGGGDDAAIAGDAQRVAAAKNVEAVGPVEAHTACVVRVDRPRLVAATAGAACVHPQWRTCRSGGATPGGATVATAQARRQQAAQEVRARGSRKGGGSPAAAGSGSVVRGAQ